MLRGRVVRLAILGRGNDAESNGAVDMGMQNWLVAMAAIAAGSAAPMASAWAAPCVEVEVNGEHAPSYDCLTEKLKPSGGGPAGRGEATMSSESIVQRPSNQLGLYNNAATSHRLGNTFGTSVYPQRPASPPPAAPVVPRGQP